MTIFVSLKKCSRIKTSLFVLFLCSCNFIIKYIKKKEFKIVFRRGRALKKFALKTTVIKALKLNIIILIKMFFGNKK